MLISKILSYIVLQVFFFIFDKKYKTNSISIKSHIAVLLLVFFFWNTIHGQKYELVNIYTVNDGLPSNHIYETIQDNKGFLWVATDNGISRFDGKRFVNYTTKNGLPSNDVIQISKEKNGTIWASCYQQPPSYFDEKSNRFISFESNKQVVNNCKRLLVPQIDPNGGIYYCFSYGYLYFKNKKFVACKHTKSNIFFIDSQKYRLQVIKKINEITSYAYVLLDNENRIVSKIYNKFTSPMLYGQNEGNGIYEFYENYFTAFQVTKHPKISFKKTNVNIPYKIKSSRILNNEVSVVTVNGMMIIYDKKTLNIKHQINTHKNANTYFKDSNNTIWITTVDNGLLKYTTSPIKTYNADFNENSNLLSIKVSSDNSIYTGNFKGNVVKNNGKTQFNYNLNDDRACWVRAIELFKDKVVTVSDFGYNINFCKNKSVNLTLFKIAVKLNDSILIMGSNLGLSKLNVLKNKHQNINSPQERIWNLKPIDATTFYFVANNGIYKYDIKSQTYFQIFPNSVLKNDNIQCIETDTKGRIWIATTKGNLYLIDKKKIILKIENSDDLPESITKLLMVNENLWIASKTGLYIVSPTKFNKYTIQKRNKADGLKSEFINDLFLKDSLIYAATSNGYATIPINKTSQVYNVLPNVISLKVNNKLKEIEDVFQLKTDETAISINLEGNDLTGHFKKFQYAYNEENVWIDLEGNILNLILKSGENNICIRALDVNNTIGKKQLTLKFNIAFPLYKQTWFWLFISGYILVIGLYVIYRRRLAKQKREFKIQIALEQQRNKITSDLHDDIGASLSSLQINSAVANLLVYKNPKEAQQVLEKIENQSQNLADKIGDIIWSMKPGKDEFMTMSMRIKNFVNDILGSTNINYKIVIDDKIDGAITDISIRKNSVLIVKEAVNNVAKYSQATQVEINLKMIEKTIFIEITDNGIGFDISKTNGNGMGNMKKRVVELNGQFDIISQLNRGTSIKATIPCP